MGGLCFGVPSSLGRLRLRGVEQPLVDALAGVGFTEVRAPLAYAALEQALLRGTIQAAWGPPLLCAGIEAAGGLVALRAVRGGETSYRSALLCRADRPVDLARLAAGAFDPVRAAWVDPRSMGGCVLPRAHLRARGIDPGEALSSETMLGSYGACLEALLDGDCELTAIYATAHGLGRLDVSSNRIASLRVVDYTGESPNDGLVLSPALPERDAIELRAQLRALFRSRQPGRALAACFDADKFDEPAPGSYAPLLALLG